MSNLPTQLVGKEQELGVDQWAPVPSPVLCATPFPDISTQTLTMVPLAHGVMGNLVFFSCLCILPTYSTINVLALN